MPVNEGMEHGIRLDSSNRTAKMKNPQPILEVASIDLFSCKSQTAACIMAMTAGKSGLMK
jgi:hypothetical protein